MMPRVLLVNPWITDFSAHDLWARPLGLLYLAGVVRRLGCEPILVDCTDRWHWSLEQRPYRPKRFSCGKYPAEQIPRPEPVAWVPRRFKRYGVPVEAFRRSLDRAGRPDLILVTSRMAYWYPGVVEAVAILRERFPDTTVVLGGAYPTLFPEHAGRFAGADLIVRGEGEIKLANLVCDIFRSDRSAVDFDLADLESLPSPAYDLLSANDCLPFLTSRGCPRKCTYCASRLFYGRFRRRDPIRAADDLVELVEKFGFQDVAFYDDALLAGASGHFLPFCDRLVEARIKVRFHAPNGLDYGEINEAVAERMAAVGFKTIRLSLETADRGALERMGRNPDLSRFEVALDALERAGFDRASVGVYVMFGFPGQSRAEVERTIDYVLGLGATPKLTEFSPLPFTSEWEKVRHMGEPPLESEPLLTNNSVFYRMVGEFPDSWLDDMRRRIREARRLD